jgi:HPt (histidine-containing phosphotransfer) domain-containing protein
MDSQAQPGAQSEALSQALDRLWVRFLPEIMERVAIIEATAAAMAAAKSSQSERENAEAAAHKLAGILGTFNLMRGTALARDLEGSFKAEDDRVNGEYIASLVARLRELIQSRKSSS